MTFEKFMLLSCKEGLNYVGYGHREIDKRGVGPDQREIYHLDTNEVVGYMDAHEAANFAVAKFQEIQEKEKNQ